MSGEQAAPSAVELHPDRLRLHWPDGMAELDAAMLRAACRCGGCRAGRNVSTDALPRLVGAEPVGLYALQLRFSDGHERGIYPWSLLRELWRDRAGTPLGFC
ncbi:DUF971 domain-containing protein [Azohydromonas australica]|uniref:DUF971 domain-containing protein n=1 Tax=Azohydromonas australica TaxID=364039 RepID=UPI000403C9B4|nr:DUF971 domain-containing protein [Azohydromonas australica]